MLINFISPHPDPKTSFRRPDSEKYPLFFSMRGRLQTHQILPNQTMAFSSVLHWIWPRKLCHQPFGLVVFPEHLQAQLISNLFGICWPEMREMTRNMRTFCRNIAKNIWPFGYFVLKGQSPGPPLGGP